MSYHRPTVKEFMTKQLHTIGEDQPLEKANTLMREYKIRHLPVLKGGKLKAVLTDRDIKLAFSLAPKEFNRKDWKVEDAAVHDVFCVQPTDDLAKVARQMAEQKIGCALVMEKSQLVGILTAVDVLKAFADVMEFKAVSAAFE